MRLLAIPAALAVLAAAPVAAQLGNPAGMSPSTPLAAPGIPAPNQPNNQDRLFVYLAAAGGMAEVDAGKMADAKARSDAVKEFARRMVQDHHKANTQLTPLANADRIALPRDLDPDHKAMRAELEKLSGPQFDLAYLRGQLVDHQKTAQILQWEINSGQDAQLQQFAKDTLPVVLQHLEMVQGLIAQHTGAGPQGLAASASPQQLASMQLRSSAR